MAPVFFMPFAPPDGSAFRYHREKVVFSCPPGHRWLRWAKLGRRSQKKCPSVEYAKLFCVSGRESYFPSSRQSQSPRHTRRHEQRTWLHPDGNPGNADTDDDPQRRRLYGWQRWQQQQRLWQTAVQVRDFLLFLRDDANAYNRDRVLRVGQDEVGWCLSAEGEGPDCASGTSFTLRPRWPGITLAGVTPGLGFYGLRSTAWAGNLRLQSAAGSWSIVISHWGRIRLCRSDSAGGCQ